MKAIEIFELTNGNIRIDFNNKEGNISSVVLKVSEGKIDIDAFNHVEQEGIMRTITTK